MEILDNSFNELLKTDTKETVTIKSGNIEVLLDVTTLGTVITVYFTAI
jgi:predicted acetyltransferase